MLPPTTYDEDRKEYRRIIAEQSREIEKLKTDLRLAILSDSSENKELSSLVSRLRQALMEIRTVNDSYGAGPATRTIRGIIEEVLE